jgi:hypothetical protein
VCSGGLTEERESSVEVGAKILAAREGSFICKNWPILAPHNAVRLISLSPAVEASSVAELLEQMKAVGEGLLEKFRELGVDETEFACLRAILLFKGASSGDVRSRLKELGKVDAL